MPHLKTAMPGVKHEMTLGSMVRSEDLSVSIDDRLDISQSFYLPRCWCIFAKESGLWAASANKDFSEYSENIRLLAQVRLSECAVSYC